MAELSYYYRFKTVKEFEMWFGKDWKQKQERVTKSKWYEGFNQYHGCILEDPDLIRKLDNNISVTWQGKDKLSWCLSHQFFVKESYDTVQWRFKTKQEFRDEYGDGISDSWRVKLTYTWVDRMDHLCGCNIASATVKSKDFQDLIIRKITFISYDKWNVSFSMITTKPLPKTGLCEVPVTKEKSRAPKYRFKTEAEMIETIGKQWRELTCWAVSHRDMEPFLGQIIDSSEDKHLDALTQPYNQFRYKRWQFERRHILRLSDPPILPFSYTTGTYPVADKTSSIKPNLIQAIKKSLFLDTPEVKINPSLLTNTTISLNQYN